MENGLNELSKYRYECAEEALEDARIMFENNRFKNALNRAYYAIFYALRSVNALDGFDTCIHKMFYNSRISIKDTFSDCTKSPV